MEITIAKEIDDGQCKLVSQRRRPTSLNEFLRNMYTKVNDHQFVFLFCLFFSDGPQKEKQLFSETRIMMA